MTLDFVGKLYEVVAKSQLKKVIKLWQQEVRKAEEKAKRDAEAEEATKRRAEEAKKITIKQDSSLPLAQKIRVKQGTDFRGKRVKVYVSNVLLHSLNFSQLLSNIERFVLDNFFGFFNSAQQIRVVQSSI